ncbi:MAG: response regulator [Nitrospirota bacterium]
MSQKPTILVVDDEPAVRASLRRLFAREQYAVLEAGGVQEAIMSMGTAQVDLVITDYAMPDGTGLDLLLMLKQRYPHVVRMIITGKADLNAVIAAINDGHVYRFVLKPWDNEDLCLSVRLALEQAKLLSEKRELVGRLEDQERTLRTLAKQYPGITAVDWDADGAIVLDDPDEEAA